MSQIVYNVVKAPVGWMVFGDRVRVGGVHANKEAALEAAAVAAALVVRDGSAVQINVPAGSIQKAPVSASTSSSPFWPFSSASFS
jgi:hypothetical protein